MYYDENNNYFEYNDINKDYYTKNYDIFNEINIKNPTFLKIIKNSMVKPIRKILIQSKNNA